ncbi:MAG TPA: ribosome small subunit-dependent GTPase A [Arenimonas sp.]|uniref:ribosome small subunit-dependent GTPase A n=1 Tax=Arenimonas sp. TaxID=1872635 RepID=UPI002C05C316|nr:ribosome small subunit-dependent GTPase A [Arenimonas sp.]HMB58242.1 ribosome small subunit-dependent GTPase A [Arenimonas sp.]
MQTDSDAFERLRVIGWPDDAALREAAGQARVARVIGQHRSGYDVAEFAGDLRRVQPPAAWTRPRGDPTLRAVVGDWVILDTDGKNILSLLPRRALLKRAAAGEHYKQQLIAANIDHVLVVSGLDADFNPRRIERYLLIIQASGASPVLVLTKADECDILDDVLEVLENERLADIPVHPVNARDAASVAVLHPYLGVGKSAVLVGSSGAGKSTLTNTLLGIDRMKTKEVRSNDQRGRHTTTYRVLIPLPQGGCLIDTPGMRELKLSGEEDLADGGFEDIETLAANCRFSDCGHSNEPGCAIRAAIEDGTLEEARYLTYCKLRDERDSAAVTLAQRRSEERAIHKTYQKRVKDKYGRH